MTSYQQVAQQVQRLEQNLEKARASELARALALAEINRRVAAQALAKETVYAMATSMAEH